MRDRRLTKEINKKIKEQTLQAYCFRHERTREDTNICGCLSCTNRVHKSTQKSRKLTE